MQCQFHEDGSQVEIRMALHPECGCRRNIPVLGISHGPIAEERCRFHQAKRQVCVCKEQTLCLLGIGSLRESAHRSILSWLSYWHRLTCATHAACHRSQAVDGRSNSVLLPVLFESNLLASVYHACVTKSLRRALQTACKFSLQERGNGVAPTMDDHLELLRRLFLQRLTQATTVL